MRDQLKNTVFFLLLLITLSVNSQENFSLKVVDVLPLLFNPSINQQAKIQFLSTRDGQALVRIYDRRAYQVREFSVENIEANKVVTVAWNGKDEQGELVPDEAYFFTIEATDIKGNIAEYDSTSTLSNRITPLQSHYDSEKNKLYFTVDADAVIDIRSGISDGGPLLTKLIQWKPYLQGKHSIDWDGWDGSHTVHVSSLKKHLFYSQTAPLPEFSMITFGHPGAKDHIYSLGFASDGLKRKSKAEFTNNRFSQSDTSPYKNLNPVFSFDFTDVISKKDELPVLGNEAGITIRLQESVKQRVTETRYEILVFVDYKFLTEIEEGRSPAKMNINTSNLTQGEHILTVNIVTLQGGLATVSKRFVKSE